MLSSWSPKVLFINTERYIYNVMNYKREYLPGDSEKQK